MPHITRLPLISASPGTRRELTAHRYGREGARPKVVLQAALHADELPGILVLDHLRRRLEAAEAEGRVVGEVVVVPVANPIGLGQSLHAQLLGRFELSGGTNFNRHYTDHAEAVLAAVQGRLGPDPAGNTALVRAALTAAWRATEADVTSEVDHLRWLLFGLAHDADLVFDLHCETEAVMHVYTSAPSWPETADVCAQLGARAVLLAEESGDQPFDEALSGPWSALRRAVGGDTPVPHGCHTFTVELRGEREVDDATAAADADNLMAVLVRRGAVEGTPSPLPEPLCAATPLTGVDMVKAPRAGLLVHDRPVGARVEAGEVLGHIVDPLAPPEEARTPFTSAASGILFARRAVRLARPGDVICKVAGPDPLPHRKGKLLTA